MDKYLELKTKNWDTWRFRCPITKDDKLPVDGLILQSLKHNNWWLAEDIRIVGIHINPNFYQKEYKYLRLNDSNFPCITPLEKIEVEAPGAPPDFASDKLKVLSGLRAVYETPEPVVIDGSKLKITQTYLFTPYSDNPAHEPSGSLQASRLYPLIKIEYPEDDKVYSIRIDYRLELKLDQLNRSAVQLPFSPAAQKLLQKTPDNFSNQVGIFRDSDEGIFPIFTAAEKPLVSEIYSNGLHYGAPKNVYTARPETWDNIHWWNEVDGLPSTPGAYHAAHLHWRWGKSLQENSILLSSAGEKQFVSKIYLGGPLLDANIPIQTINFAVAKKKDERKVEIDTTRKLNDFFKTDTTIPDQISGVDDKTKKEIKTNDLCLWFSVEIFSSVLLLDKSKIKKAGINGSTFIHGLFFAHEPEPSLISKPSLLFSNRSGLYLNPNKPDKKQWIRVPGSA